MQKGCHPRPWIADKGGGAGKDVVCAASGYGANIMVSSFDTIRN